MHKKLEISTRFEQKNSMEWEWWRFVKIADGALYAASLTLCLMQWRAQE